MSTTQYRLFSNLDLMTIDPDLDATVLQEITKSINNTTDRLRLAALSLRTVFDRLPDLGSLNNGSRKDRWTFFNVPAFVTYDSLRTFIRDQSCADCGTRVCVFFVEKHINDRCAPYLALYGMKNGALARMTVDHILPRSLGGRDSPKNYQTMCYDCNINKERWMSSSDIDKVVSNIDNHAKNWVSPDYLAAVLGAQRTIIEADTKTQQELKRQFRELLHGRLSAQTLTPNLVSKFQTIAMS